ncbi:EF-P lysine aminoacylase GenX [Candidatus Gottesmanbacteria bacterium RIFCSPLOWO2_02_FULL_42_29]|uniref:EF-P lysine aminoacylase GenX n=2 Tax=Candidatus Gottesmaniibacteriota TaxID=1752720 RepID=A0A1F6BB63_9BACT|nr:MAG: Lysyl-tRNA synthetase [Candidatus Gottesmanbacteria bacterium GW2011_GWA2_42_18]OGG10740.1 MAG: EF-P lysine aminoacylase GenX [Candidatus Gottesmanbacteria bacterium RIFCSPHIGHO2_01_FULL_42_27]OGG21903.1 MAG: EF-P lysine aminoacylase GenX [Candidatus Gottesmanbacteria bacterium RIFCSPHIGHO2_12_FULL_43_26]OGG34201.1 MAG: EF-P lysine aminoacylase GenX [Candidatus Gottesmanbacteria bacterium RIFCSPLOWO2_01_FULL_42_22]OGG38705.1 MAG: EF-P lysine aminoacylase GenX [Candidatus Gottesmanbacter
MELASAPKNTLIKINLKNWQIRSEITWQIRNYFRNLGFREAETPTLRPSLIPESYLEVFKTQLLDRNRKGKKMYLAASPEASLKKLLSAGFGNCFEISRVFRNSETGSDSHQPEFTMLEWYRVNSDYIGIMDDCFKLFNHIYISLKKKSLIKSGLPDGTIQYSGKLINLKKPWLKISMSEALKKYAQIDFDNITDKDGWDLNSRFPAVKISAVSAKKGYQVSEYDSWEEIFNQIYLNEIEPHFKGETPVIIYDFPRPMAALAKLKEDDPRLAERFELYIAGLELADCYSELTDWREQQARFEEETKLRKKLTKTPVKWDREFIMALKSGLPLSSGVALGIDRTAMLFCDTKNIRDVLLFPFE